MTPICMAALAQQSPTDCATLLCGIGSPWSFIVTDFNFVPTKSYPPDKFVFLGRAPMGIKLGFGAVPPKGFCSVSSPTAAYLHRSDFSLHALLTLGPPGSKVAFVTTKL
jgi:hypothetical protein